MLFPGAQRIWVDGRLVPWEEATVHVTAHALHYGSSVFEGIRAYATPQGPAIFCLDAHLNRLYSSCKIVRMEPPFAFEEVRQACQEVILTNELPSAYIRPLVFRGSGTLGLDPRPSPVHVMVMAYEWGRYLGAAALEEGVDVMVSSWRRMAPGTLPALAKLGGQYVNSQLVAMEAADGGFVEGIVLDVQGMVSEGSGENIFVVRNGFLYTPPVGASILMGVTRQVVLRLCADLGLEVREQSFPRELLYLADEVFFTGTAAEITPVRSIDRLPVGAGRRGPITERLQEAFFGIIEGRTEDRHGWLTPAAPAAQPG